MTFKDYWTKLNAEGRKKFCRDSGISRVHASMIAGGRRISRDTAEKIEAASGGLVTREVAMFGIRAA